MMFSQLVFVRLKAAEKALRDGRLDEAYRLATAADLRTHRRAVAILAELTDRLIERARGHFRAHRFAEALADLERARAGEKKGEEIAELRAQVQTVAAELERKDASRRRRVQAAKRRIEGGSLAAGRRLLEQVTENDQAAQRLQREADNRAWEVMDIVDQTEKLVERGQFGAAADRLRRVKSLDARDERVARLEGLLCEKALAAAREAFVSGRLGWAASELACLGGLGKSLPGMRELTEFLTIAKEAWRCVHAGRYAEARRQVMSLARMLPDTPWIEQAVEQMRQIDELRTVLAAGPLGELSETDAGVGERAGFNPVGMARSVPTRTQTAGARRLKAPAGEANPATRGGSGAGRDLPQRLLLLVDGGGSYLVLRGDRASVGRVACDDPPEVAIFSDLAERHAELVRVDEDYFLFSGRDVQVGGVKTQHQLLRDGDPVRLGRKAKLVFRLLSRKSPTAILDLSDTTKMPNDVRRVILFHHHATIGQGERAHIRGPQAGLPLVLFERDGSLWIRAQNDGHVDREAVRLGLGEPVEVHGVSLVLEPWRIRPPAATKL
jgi:hypothetical protein